MNIENCESYTSILNSELADEIDQFEIVCKTLSHVPNGKQDEVSPVVSLTFTFLILDGSITVSSAQKILCF